MKTLEIVNPQPTLSLMDNELPTVYRIDSGGARWYYTVEMQERTAEDGTTGMALVPRYYPSVTTFLSAVLPKGDGLMNWAVDTFASVRDYRSFLDNAAHYGTLLHILFGERLTGKAIDLDERLGDRSDDGVLRAKDSGADDGVLRLVDVYHNYCADNGLNYDEHWDWLDKLRSDLYAIERWVRDYNVEPLAVEMTLASPLHGLAGTLDVVCRITHDGNGNPFVVQAEPDLIPFSPELTIVNLEQLPKGGGNRYLEVVRGEDGALVAKQWRRKTVAGAVMVDFKPDTAAAADTTERPQAVTEVVLVDLKSGCRNGDFYPEYQMQLAMYMEMWNVRWGHTENAVQRTYNLSPKDWDVRSRTFYNFKEQTPTERLTTAIDHLRKAYLLQLSDELGLSDNEPLAPSIRIRRISGVMGAETDLKAAYTVENVHTLVERRIGLDRTAGTVVPDRISVPTNIHSEVTAAAVVAGMQAMGAALATKVTEAITQAVPDLAPETTQEQSEPTEVGEALSLAADVGLEQTESQPEPKAAVETVEFVEGKPPVGMRVQVKLQRKAGAPTIMAIGVSNGFVLERIGAPAEPLEYVKEWKPVLTTTVDQPVTDAEQERIKRSVQHDADTASDEELEAAADILALNMLGALENAPEQPANQPEQTGLTDDLLNTFI